MRTRFIRLFPILLAVLLVGATQVYAQTATVVTHSGQRIRGQVPEAAGMAATGTAVTAAMATAGTTTTAMPLSFA
jgi:hypothetical protein